MEFKRKNKYKFFENFLNKVKEPENLHDCWEWQAYLTEFGYGRFGIWGKLYYAHRIMWKIFNGNIAGGYCVLHKCDNPKCVNPEHLFLGTKKDNCQDCKQKGRLNRAKGENNGSAKLTDNQASYIKHSTKANIILAKMFNIDRNTPNSIKTGKAWKHIK